MICALSQRMRDGECLGDEMEMEMEMGCGRWMLDVAQIDQLTREGLLNLGGRSELFIYRRVAA
jgi:hypothetical protein